MQKKDAQITFRHGWSDEPEKWYTPEAFLKEMKKQNNVASREVKEKACCKRLRV